LSMSTKLPHSIDAEKSVLRAIFLDGNCAPAVFDGIREEDFYDPNQKLNYIAMKDLFNQRTDIDYTSLSSHLSHKGQLETVGGLSYLIELSNYPVSIAHLDTYMDIVRDYSLKRDVISVTQSLAADGLTSDIDSLQYLDKVEPSVLA